MKTLFTILALVTFTSTAYAATPSNPDVNDAHDTHLRLNFLGKRPYVAPVEKADESKQPWEGTSAVKPAETEPKNNINQLGRQPYRGR